MAHDATHGHDHDHDHAAPLPGTELKSKTGLRSAFFLVVIIAGLFIAALNFISAMGHSEGEGHNGHEAGEAHAPATHQATSNQTMEGEGGSGKPVEHGTHEAGTATHDDTAAQGGHH